VALLVLSSSHICFTAIWAQDVVSVSEEALSNESNRAFLAVEVLIVPMTFLKGNILGASESRDGFLAVEALLGE